MQFWKVKREIARFRQQLMAIPELVIEPLQNRRYDRDVRPSLAVVEGHTSYTSKVAVFLIYQPNGVSDSVIDTCQYLISKGYAPFILSNSPLSQADLVKLSPFAWRILARPNFGHDFGGYREGLVSLLEWGIEPKFLCILNDSIWFPVYETETLIETAERQPNAISGTILRERDETRFLESYFYIVPAPVFRSAAFRNYWYGLRLTSNKYKVIRRGERGFSQAMARAGVALNPVFPVEEFLSRLERVDEKFLRETLRYGTFPDAPLENKRKALLAANHDGWRKDALAFIRSTIPKRMPYSAFPYAMTRLMGYPVLKKTSDPVSKNWRETTVKAWHSGDLPLPRKVVISEAVAKR